MITVVNKRSHTPTQFDYKIHRPTALGNPYSHIKGRMTLAHYYTATPQEAIEKYRGWLLTQLLDKNSAAYIEFHRLVKVAQKHDINLVCYCAPRHCHGDFIKKLIENLLFPANGEEESL